MKINENRAIVPIRRNKIAIPAIVRKWRFPENGGAGTGRWDTPQSLKGDRQFFRDSMRQWRKSKEDVELKPRSVVLAVSSSTQVALRRSFMIGAATAVGVAASLLFVIAIMSSIFEWTGPMPILGTSAILSAFSAGLFVQSIQPEPRISQYGSSDFPAPDAPSQK